MVGSREITAAFDRKGPPGSTQPKMEHAAERDARRDSKAGDGPQANLKAGASEWFWGRRRGHGRSRGRLHDRRRWHGQWRRRRDFRRWWRARRRGWHRWWWCQRPRDERGG